MQAKLLESAMRVLPIMNRREFLLAVPLVADAPPTDPERLNDFVEQYNGYAGKLAEGVIDLKRWKLVLKKWRALQ